MSKVFANGPGNQGSIPGRVIPKTQKMILDDSLHNTQHYKVRIKGKEEQFREWRRKKEFLMICKRLPVSFSNCKLLFIFVQQSKY